MLLKIQALFFVNERCEFRPHGRRGFWQATKQIVAFASQLDLIRPVPDRDFRRFIGDVRRLFGRPVSRDYRVIDHPQFVTRVHFDP